MSHVGLVTPPFLGHLNPILALAAALESRGHRVTLFGLEDVEDVARRHGVRLIALGAQSHPPGTLAAMAERMAAPGGFGLFRIMRDMIQQTRMYCRELPAACSGAGIDGLVVDELEPAGGLVAAHLDLPFVSVASALPIRRDPLLPPPFVGWRYDASPRGLARNRGGYKVADLLMRPVFGAVAHEATRFGLKRRSLESCLSPLADITQLVPELDFPRSYDPKEVHPCGPLRGREDEADLAPLLSGDRPLVFASLGSLQGGRLGLFRRIAEACQRLEAHLVIAHGGRLDDALVADLPGRPVVRAFVPQRALLRHAALAVTNGGLNTVLDAVAAGVPTLVLPIAFEQAAIGARLEHAGVGLVLSRHRLGPRRLETAMRHLLTDPDLRRRTHLLAQSLAAAGGVQKAAAIVEEVVRTGRSVAAHYPPTPARIAEPA